jgi:hypothetical protein
VSRYKYYINGVLQRSIPEKPIPTQSLKITEKSIIGKDNIKSVSKVTIDNKITMP